MRGCLPLLLLHFRHYGLLFIEMCEVWLYKQENSFCLSASLPALPVSCTYYSNVPGVLPISGQSIPILNAVVAIVAITTLTIPSHDGLLQV